MWKNYLIIAFRRLTRNKLFASINIIGLAIGMASACILLLWSLNELSYDNFHKNKDRIFRVIQHIKYSDVVDWAITQGPVGPELKEAYPEIEYAIRYSRTWWPITYDENKIVKQGAFIDPEVFEMFDFNIIEGSADDLSTKPHTVVLSEGLKKTLFGEEDAINKTILVGQKTTMTVIGVFEDLTDNSQFSFEFVGSWEFGKEIGYTIDKWNNSGYYNFIQLREGTDYKETEKKIYNFLDDKPTLEDWEKLSLQPLEEMYLATGIDYDFGIKGNRQYVVIFTIAAIFILLIASINFVNLTTAKSLRRAREVGLRKTIGAINKQLIYQFLVESLLIVLIAHIISMFLVELALPYFNQLTSNNLIIDYQNPVILLSIIGVVFLVGLIAGIFPSIYLSKFQPIQTLRETFISGQGSGNIRKVLTIFQFAISIILIGGTIVIYSQLNFMSNINLGYEKDNLVQFNITSNLDENKLAFENDLRQDPNVISFGRSSSSIDYGYAFSNALWNWDGMAEEENILFRASFVDTGFFKTMGMQILKGRNFDSNLASDSVAVIINNTAAKLINYDQMNTKTIRNGDRTYRIVGVVNDYNFRSLHNEIEPMIHIFRESNLNIMYVKFREVNKNTLSEFRKRLNEFSPGYIYDIDFVDYILSYLYDFEEKAGKSILFFTLLALIIASLGLFGMANFISEQRKKEIAIRKSIGASILQITTLLSRDFTKWVLIANIFALPGIYFIAKNWLQNFAYQTKIDVFLFIYSAAIAYIISLITVLFTAYSSSKANPVDVFRAE